MSAIYPWIYRDYTNNIWKFLINENKELCYKIMYGEGKWTKENLIDKEVLGFAVYVEQDETIHIVYSNIKRELKYCTMKDKQWVGKMLYQMENDEFEIQNLKIKIIGYDMHIFYLLVSKNGSNHAVLTHFIWNGKETKITTIQDIVLIPNLNDYYSININEENSIDVFFITDEGDEISLNYCSFQNYRWSSIKRLYGIQGEDIGFEVIRYEQEIHILNKSREGSIYFLDHVYIDISGNIQDFRINESTNKLSEPLLFIEGNKLYSCWLEQDNIFYSVFDGEKWSNSFYFNRGNKIEVKRYNCFISSDGENSIKARGVYGTDELDLCLFIPNSFVVNIKNPLKYELNKIAHKGSNEEDEFQDLKIELSEVKSDKKNLEKKVIFLNTQLQKKQRFIEEYEEQIAKILEQKRKVEENYNVFLELQQNVQKQLDEKVKDLEEKNEQLIKLKNDLEEKNEQLVEEKNIRTSIENKLRDFQEKNIIIMAKIKKINEEKKKLHEELEIEKNQSIVERLLRKKSTEI